MAKQHRQVTVVDAVVARDPLDPRGDLMVADPPSCERRRQETEVPQTSLRCTDAHACGTPGAASGFEVAVDGAQRRAAGVWQPGEDFGDRDTAWARGFFAALDRFREGVYVNFLAADEGPDRVREAYGYSIYARLVDVKTRYDPDNIFHHNQNIRPRFG